MELAESMRSLVAAFHQSGMSQKDFAASHDMSFHKFNYWVRKFRDEALPKNGFVKVKPLVSSTDSDFIEICYPNGVVIKAAKSDISFIRQLISIY